MPASLDPTPKREAETALPTYSPKRRCSSVPNTLSWSSSPFPTLTPSPEPSSINAILRQHCRSRLYVRPLHWTSRQLQLLGCHYAPQGPQQDTAASPDLANAAVSERCHATPNPQTRVAGMLSSEAVVWTANLILVAQSLRLKTVAIHDLLEIHGILHYARATMARPHRPGAFYDSFDLPLYFRQQLATTLRTDGVFSCSSTPSVPFLGYLDLKSLGERRDNSIKLSFSRPRPNSPVARLRTKYQSRIRPPYEPEDPYIMACLIALAQFRRRKLSVGGETTEASEVNLLALTADSRSLYFYTARIPFTFLDRLDYPSRYTPDGSFSVTYHHIPLTSKPRLLREMGWVLAAIRDDMSSTPPIGLGRAAENPCMPPPQVWSGFECPTSTV